MIKPLFFTSKAKISIAYLHDGPTDTASSSTGMFWLGGFMSDMRGSKAEIIAEYARTGKRPFMRMDYSGHGESSGKFADGTISRWLDEAVSAFQLKTKGPRIIIGSSMGGWLALLLYRYLRENAVDDAKRIKALVLIAPAADMTQKLMWDKYDATVRQSLVDKGLHYQPSDYGDEPYLITNALIEDGKKHLLMHQPFKVDCPVRILQGEADSDVPWQHAKALYDIIAGKDVSFTLVKHGDHRLSRPNDLQNLLSVLEALAVAGDGR